MRGKTYGFETFQQNNPEQISPQDQEAYARSVVRANTFGEAFAQLHEQSVLQEQVHATKEKYQKALETADFLTEKDWELITMIELYAPELTTHSIETYTLARSKVEHIFLHGGLNLEQSIRNEKVSLEEFYRACILHDIGKTLIPEPILNYTLEPGDWYGVLNKTPDSNLERNIKEHLGIDESRDMERHELIALLMDSNFDPITALPAQKLLPQEHLDELKKRGIAVEENTLKEILKLHEPESQRILEEEGYHTEALIAGQHHNYNKEEYRFPISSQTIGLNADLAEILHLADGEQAMLSERSYKPAFSRIQAFTYLMKDAEKGAINKELTALWIQHDIEKGLVKPENENDALLLGRIMQFVEENTHTA